MVQKLGKGALLAKADIKFAFRLLRNKSFIRCLNSVNFSHGSLNSIATVSNYIPKNVRDLTETPHFLQLFEKLSKYRNTVVLFSPPNKKSSR
jgi:hypothetical protein